MTLFSFCKTSAYPMRIITDFITLKFYFHLNSDSTNSYVTPCVGAVANDHAFYLKIHGQFWIFLQFLFKVSSRYKFILVFSQLGIKLYDMVLAFLFYRAVSFYPKFSSLEYLYKKNKSQIEILVKHWMGIKCISLVCVLSSVFSLAKV